MTVSNPASWPARRNVQSRYDLLMALSHLLEGTELYARAVTDAQQYDNPNLAEFFRSLENNSRLHAETARHLLEKETQALTGR